MSDGRYTRYGTRPGRDPRRRRRQRDRRRRLLLVLVVAFIAVIFALVVVARGRERGGGAETGPSGAEAPAATVTPTPVPPPKVWAASKAHPVRVWVGGDSMGGELGWALEPVLRTSIAFKAITYYKESTGFCRYDYFDWGKQIKTVVKTAKPQAAVVMIGTNDTQSVWKDGAWISYGRIEWKRAYEDRVGTIIDTMLRGGVRRVYWVGMPIMGESWRNSRMRFINRIFQKQVEKRPGAEYIDVWDLYSNADGSFDPSLRLADGVHFTVEGQELLARTVFAAIRRDWMHADAATPGPSPSALPSASASSI
jgi:hypothetical protein